VDAVATLEAAVKAAQYAALLLGVGACAVHWRLLRAASGDLAPGRIERLDRSAAAIGLAAAALALAAAAARAWVQAVSAFGLSGSWSAQALRTVAIESRWGGRWQWQAVAAIVNLAAWSWTRRGGTWGWPMVALSGVGCSVALALLGHASGHPLRVGLHTLHMLGAGAWVGTLVTVLLLTPDVDERRALFCVFAPLALASAALLAGAGIAMSCSYLGRVSDLWTTTYGERLLTKVGLACGVGLCGFVNWRTFRGAVPGSGPWRVVLTETALATAVVVMTGVLTETAHP